MPVTIDCKNCNDTFEVPPSREDAVFCSMECRSNFSSIEIDCQFCGESFSVPEHKSDRNYCSQNCQYKSMEKSYPKVSCENCGDEYSVKPSQVDRTRYCSRECLGEGTSYSKDSEKVEITCAFCEDVFRVFPNRADTAVTCSWECRAKYLSEEMRGSDPKIRATKEYRDWRNEVLSTFDSCNECGSEENLRAHHIIPISESEEKATDVDNGVALCKSCHAQEHPEIENLINQNPY